MKRYGLLISVFIIAAVYSTPAQYQGCGPQPNVPTVSQQQSQAAQQARQISIVQAQFDYQQRVAQIQHSMRLSQMQNQGANNPQIMQGYQQQLRTLQEQFQSQLQALQRQ
jgi:hypothetical protein